MRSPLQGKGPRGPPGQPSPPGLEDPFITHGSLEVALSEYPLRGVRSANQHFRAAIGPKGGLIFPSWGHRGS